MVINMKKHISKFIFILSIFFSILILNACDDIHAPTSSGDPEADNSNTNDPNLGDASDDRFGDDEAEEPSEEDPLYCGEPTIITPDGLEIAQGTALTLTWVAPETPSSQVTYFISVMNANDYFDYVEVTPDWINDTSYTIDSKFLPNAGSYFVILYAKADGYRESDALISVCVK